MLHLFKPAMFTTLYRFIIRKAYNAYSPIRARKARKTMELKKKLGFNNQYQPESISIDELHRSLQQNGLKSTDTVFVRTSLSAAQSFKGGVSAFLEGLKSYFSEGTIMMSSYTFDKSPLMYLADDPLFDPQKSIDRLNLVSEFFRRSVGVKRSIHPTHSVVVWGKDAEWFVKNHHNSPFCYDKESPFAKLYQRNAIELSFGVFPTSLSYHYIEQFVPKQNPSFRDFENPIMCKVVIEDIEQTLPFKITNSFRYLAKRNEAIRGTKAEALRHSIGELDYYSVVLNSQLEALLKIINDYGSFHIVKNKYYDFVLNKIISPIVISAFFYKRDKILYPLTRPKKNY